MNSQNSNTLNSNSFMHFSERVYGNPNDWLSKKDNNIYSKSFILLTFTFSFWILSDVARLLNHPLYCVLFAYGSVIFSGNIIRCISHSMYFPRSACYFADRLSWIICLPFLFALWFGEKLLIKLETVELIPFIPYIIGSLTIYCSLGLYIMSFILQNFASDMYLFIISHNNPLFNDEACCRLIVVVTAVIVYLSHTLTCLLIFKVGIAMHITSSSYERLKKGLKNINKFIFPIISVLIFLLNLDNTDALFWNSISEALNLFQSLAEFFLLR